MKCGSYRDALMYPIILLSPCDQAHIAARTVRHFLQRSLKPKAPEDEAAFGRHSWSLPGADPLIVFCVTEAEIAIYKEILALYFPRF